MKTSANTLLAAMIALSAVGCHDPELQNELSEMRAERELLEANKTVVTRAHEEVWNSGNLAAVDELYAEEFIAHWAYGEDSDREGLKEIVAESRTAFPDKKESIVHIVAEGDLVVTHFVSSGTFTGEIDGLQATGQKVSRPEIAVHRLLNGKIVEQWTVADQLTLMEAMGLM
jgi:steroid delta-isomerase-like uncharacterized protein